MPPSARAQLALVPCEGLREKSQAIQPPSECRMSFKREKVTQKHPQANDPMQSRGPVTFHLLSQGRWRTLQRSDGSVAGQATDKKRYELMLRGCENASRLATIAAMGRGADRVEIEDMRRAIEWANLSAANMQRRF
jgi:hypothetical protein